MSIECDLASDYGRILGELATPERIADYHPRRTAPTNIIGSIYQSSQRCVHSESVEVISTNVEAAGVAHLATRTKIECSEAPGCNMGERLIVVSDLFPLRV